VSRSGGENDKIVSFVTAFCHYGCTHEMDDTGSKLSRTLHQFARKLFGQLLVFKGE